MNTSESSTLDELRRRVGPEHVLTEGLQAHTEDWRGKYHGRALAVVRPADTSQVSAVVKLCAERRVQIVPQGGNTSICGASVPDGSGRQLILSLSRLNRIRELDPANNTITAEAGVILQHLQEAAAQAGRLFPLSLGAEGSCQIGGNISTNAGGVQVLRYGNTRELVLGLEVVMPDGDVLDLLRALRKDNTGYDLKQCFIGAEGTLGIVTAATLKLFPLPASAAVAFAGTANLQNAVALLQHMRARMGERFTAFEVMSGEVVELVHDRFPGTARVLNTPSRWYVLMEASDSAPQEALDAAMEATLGDSLEAGLIDDVAMAQSQAQAAALWQIRENVPEAQQLDGANIKHDIALPISRVPSFVDEVLPALQQSFPGCRPLIFGHLGDGNLHFNVAAPAGVLIAVWQARTDEVNQVVHDVVVRLKGSISAEHGIGVLKRHELAVYKSPAELRVMWAIKHALDPLGLMNPGKVLPPFAERGTA